MDLNGKYVLINTNSFQSFAGSEIVTLEIIEWFVSKGAKVDLFTNVFGSPIADEVAELISQQKLSVYNHLNQPDKSFNDYSVIWVNHSLLPVELVKKLGTSELKSKMIWHHMGVLPPLEAPLLVEAEDELATSITFISQEVKEKLLQSLSQTSKFKLFDNPSPNIFGSYSSSESNSELTKLLVISNHPPKEITDCLTKLSNEGIQVEILGTTGKPVRVDPSVLDNFDAILTIGKSTQYALSMGKPVYSYDHFGGAGWIIENNIDLEAKYNFSGRADYRKLTSDELKTELINEYLNAKNFAWTNRKLLSEKWNLDNHLERLFNSNLGYFNSRQLSEVQYNQVLTLCIARQSMDQSINSLRNHYDDLTVQVKEILTNHNLAHDQLFKLQNSLSWKITKPFRMLAHQITKIKQIF